MVLCNRLSQNIQCSCLWWPRLCSFHCLAISTLGNNCLDSCSDNFETLSLEESTAAFSMILSMWCFVQNVFKFWSQNANFTIIFAWQTCTILCLWTPFRPRHFHLLRSSCFCQKDTNQPISATNRRFKEEKSVHVPLLYGNKRSECQFSFLKL